MKHWMRWGIPVVVVALVVAAGAAVIAAGNDGGGDDGQRQAETDDALAGDVDTNDGGAAAICLEGTTDCVDTVDDAAGGAAGGTCLEGTADCVDAPLGEGEGGQWRCHPDAPDCDDMIPYTPCPDGVTDEECKRLQERDQTNEPICAAPEPVDEGDAAIVDCDPPSTGTCNPAQGECLPPDCSVSSDGTVSCPDPRDGSGTDGEPGQSAPGSPGGTDADGGSVTDPGSDPASEQ